MTRSYTKVTVDQIFRVKTGDFHATKELTSGSTPLVACGDTNNGILGFFDIPEEQTYSRTLTVAYNGTPLTTKFHPYTFGAKDDVAVLLPRNTMKESTLLYVAAFLNSMIWRYTYHRKCYREKLRKISLLLPVKSSEGEEFIDEEYIAGLWVGCSDKIFNHLALRAKIISE